MRLDYSQWYASFIMPIPNVQVISCYFHVSRVPMGVFCIYKHPPPQTDKANDFALVTLIQNLVSRSRFAASGDLTIAEVS